MKKIVIFSAFLGITMPFGSFGEDKTMTVEKASSEQTQVAEQHTINEVHAKHILVESEAQANEILQKIRKGEMTFEEAAKENSKCPSGSNGGDLGFFGRGMMVKEFENVAFSTPPKQISAPVKTQFGWHLIKVEETR